MPIYSGGGGVGGITVEEDPSALKMAQNLADLQDDPTARTNLGVYSTTETDSAISYQLGSYTPPAPTFPVVSPNGTPVTPSRTQLNMGTVVCNNGMGDTIYLDAGTGGWQVGDKFAISTVSSNVYIYSASSNTINGSGTSHSINQAGVHWVCLNSYDGMGNYVWSIG